MQLRLAPIAFQTTGTKFNLSVSGILSGVTAVGTLTAVVVNSGLADSQITKALTPLKSLITDSSLYRGISSAAGKLKDWGSAIVGSKDAFASWVKEYLNPHGLKAGVAQLYQKLKDWALIVYAWFRDKFWTFITNIPEMIRKWDQLRLSLFKWGTFLGGGGGAALWAMFGSGENWGKLQELMGRPDFEEIMGSLGKLMENNSEAFQNMAPEKVQEILQQFLDNTEDAMEATKELLERQEERKKEKKNEQEELSTEEIEEEFTSGGGGNPPTTKDAFGKAVSTGLGRLVTLFEKTKGNSTFYAHSPQWDAYEGIKEYIQKIEDGAKRDEEKGKKDTARVKFVNAIKGNKVAFMTKLAGVAEKAYKKLVESKPEPKTITEKEMAEEFKRQFENTFTTRAEEGQGNLNLDAKIFMKAKSKT